MDINDVIVAAPDALAELTRELVRRGDEEYKKDNKSQLTACLLLSIRSASLLLGITRLIEPETHDSEEVLLRAFLEARDLLLTFRFDHKGTRTKVAYWFAGKVDNSWKAEHKKCEEFLSRIGSGGSEFGKRWSMTTTLAHPTVFAAQNSAVCASSWAGDPPRELDFQTRMQAKIADYLACIVSLIVIATYDFPELISLGCDLDRMPNIDAFKANAFAVSKPILDRIKDGDLPRSSYSP